ncbi:MAG: GGDEF domain-containing protein [Alteromonadaceae bacterium TMED7]|nr:diguanylate cyclase [Alteromonadaceae bacterium]MCP4866763.1 GGDEF domain-containing protein [Alteromonas sp.]RPH19681.1 MAG: GGDEF domain-containing protein [Alteromonadaceae bacterium TMED7]
MSQADVDHFPCLLFVTHIESTQVLSGNSFAESFLNVSFSELSLKLTDILSKASLIFYESYIKPILLNYGTCKEVQITIVTKAGSRVPAVANVSLVAGKLYWAMYPAEERDKLYQELVSARENLEEKTEELTRLTRLDPLTSLLNRRALTSDLTKIVTFMKRKYVPVCLVLIDIDYFKPINDNFGHEYGDEVLSKLASSLTNVVRESDLVARWGGEEFVVALYNSDLDGAEYYCSRIHEAVQKISLPNSEHLTVSIGVSAIEPEDVKDKDVISKTINIADSALYKAKNNGRNQTQFG